MPVNFNEPPPKRAKKKLGQHFLKDRAVLRAIAENVKIEPKGIILEIGPGHGELTEFLAKEGSAKLILFEKDGDLVPALRKRYPLSTIVEGDVLKTLKEAVSVLNEPYVVTGNIPYYLTGQLLRILGKLEPKPMSCILTMQREVAERLTAKPPKMNKLALFAQAWADIKTIHLIPSKSFSPEPRVDSATVLLKTKKDPLTLPEAFAASIFAQPRKTILNNISRLYDKKDKNTVAKVLEGSGIDVSARSQNLEPRDVLQIYKALSGGGLATGIDTLKG